MVKRDNPLKHFLLAFALAIVLYAVSYSWIEHRRTLNGPWQITFTNDPASHPVLVLEQPALNLTNIQFVLLDARVTNLAPTTMSFAKPHLVPYELPFGECVFMDTTFLPGTLTLRLFGHEIEFRPRRLLIDHDEHRWHSGERIEVPPSVMTATNR